VETEAVQSSAGVLITSRRGADVLAFLLMLIFATSAIALYLVPIVTDDLRESMGLTNGQIGLLASVFMGFYGVAAFLAGMGAVRWGGRLLLLSCGCFAVGSLIFALSSGFAGFLVGRAVQGFGGGLIVATCSPVLAGCLPRDRLARAWGILGAGWGVGTMAAFLIWPSIEHAGGYRAVFLANAGWAVVVGVAALSQRAVRALPRYSDEAKTFRAITKSLRDVATNRRVLILGLVNAAGLAISVGVLEWTPSFFQDIHGSAEAISFYLVAGVGAAAIVGNPLGALTLRWVSKFWVIVISLTLMAVTTAVIGLAVSASVAFLMVMIGGVFSFFSFPAVLGYQPEIVAKPEQVGPATGINTTMGFIASLVAPWIFGLLLDAGGQSQGSYMAGYLVLVAFCVAAIIAMFFFGSKEWAKRPAKPRQEA
jgi:predicted MFS family arabinose efflux permease